MERSHSLAARMKEVNYSKRCNLLVVLIVVDVVVPDVLVVVVPATTTRTLKVCPFAH